MNYPLRGFATSPKGDDTLAAVRPLLGISGLGCASLMVRGAGQ